MAAAAAGDAWKAIGARDEARAAYARAAALGGVSPGDVGIMPRRTALPPRPPEASRPRTSTPTCSRARRCRRACCRWSPRFRGCSIIRRARSAWAETLLAEDPTSPDVLELVAVIWGRAGRFGGTERMLMELAYHSPDRAAGIARGAAVWERVGRPREACAQWIRAARWRDDPEDPVWRKALACARRDPGAGDPKAIRDYVVSRARPERRDGDRRRAGRAAARSRTAARPTRPPTRRGMAARDAGARDAGGQ